MIGRSPISAILFTSLESSKSFLANYDMTMNQRMAMSGSFAGFMYTNVAFIFDLLKVRA